MTRHPEGPDRIRERKIHKLLDRLNKQVVHAQKQDHLRGPDLLEATSLYLIQLISSAHQPGRKYYLLVLMLHHLARLMDEKIDEAHSDGYEEEIEVRVEILNALSEIVNIVSKYPMKMFPGEMKDDEGQLSEGRPVTH